MEPHDFTTPMIRPSIAIPITRKEKEKNTAASTTIHNVAKTINEALSLENILTNPPFPVHSAVLEQNTPTLDVQKKALLYIENLKQYAKTCSTGTQFHTIITKYVETFTVPWTEEEEKLLTESYVDLVKILINSMSTHGQQSDVSTVSYSKLQGIKTICTLPYMHKYEEQILRYLENRMCTCAFLRLPYALAFGSTHRERVASFLEKSCIRDQVTQLSGEKKAKFQLMQELQKCFPEWISHFHE